MPLLSLNLIKDASLSPVPKRALSTKQDVGDDTNTPHIRLWARFSLQHLWGNIVCTSHHIMEPFACIKNEMDIQY
jgi:hypothetical protein